MEKKIETISAGRQVVMSGIRPTGFLHLGNYFGAISNEDQKFLQKIADETVKEFFKR